MKIATLALLALVTPLAGFAGEVRSKSTVVLGEIGLHCPYEITRTDKAPDTEAGHIDRFDGDGQAIALTTTVPGILGLAFGVEIALAEGVTLPGAELVITHPPMGDAGITEQRWTPNLTQGDFALDLYRFDLPYEILMGTWTMSLMYDGQAQMRVEFDVVPPPAGMTLDSLCSGEQTLS